MILRKVKLLTGVSALMELSKGIRGRAKRPYRIGSRETAQVVMISLPFAPGGGQKTGFPLSKPAVVRPVAKALAMTLAIMLIIGHRFSSSRRWAQARKRRRDHGGDCRRAACAAFGTLGLCRHEAARLRPARQRETEGIDPVLPFKFVLMKGGNAQEAGAGWLDECVIFDSLLPFPFAPVRWRTSNAGAPGKTFELNASTGSATFVPAVDVANHRRSQRRGAAANRCMARAEP